jgi:hypothetical protein
VTLVFTNRSGIGDDLMVFWAAAAAAIAGVVPPGVSLYFENQVSRRFLQTLAPMFPEIVLSDSASISNRFVVVRPKQGEFGGQGFCALLRRRLTGKSIYCDPYIHKARCEFGEFGPKWKPDPSTRFAITIGLLRVWTPPYDETYDGWQQLSIGLGFTNKRAAATARDLAPSWLEIRNRLSGWQLEEHHDTKLCLFLPGAGSFHDFGPGFIRILKELRPDLKVVRFRRELGPADIYFDTLEEVARLIANAELVVTNDSMPSHLAQFLSKQHVLICTRSRPGNVCFPGCAKTRIVDLGKSLECRPCTYYPLGEVKACPAGFARCKAQLELDPDKVTRLREALQ